MKLRLLVVVLCGLAIALASSTLAFAQGPTQSAYSGAGASQISQIGSSSNDALPFTGMDLGLITAVAVVLVGTGLVLRRVSKGSTD